MCGGGRSLSLAAMSLFAIALLKYRITNAYVKCFAACRKPAPFGKGAKGSRKSGQVGVLLQGLGNLQGLVQREGRARQGCLNRVCPEFR